MECSLFYQISVKYKKKKKNKKHSQTWKEKIKFKKKLKKVQDEQGEASSEEGIIRFTSF